MKKIFPLSLARTEQLASQFGTPFYIYDEKAIRANIRKFIKAFSIFPDFTEFFAVKALPNPYILKILASEGCGADCSSLPELILAERAGITGEQVMFTSNNTPEKEFVYANMKGNILNLDDITHIEFVEKACGNCLIIFLLDIIPVRLNKVA
jgi:diaminopimelate decarboxylase